MSLYYTDGIAEYCTGADFSVILLVIGFESSLRLAAHTVINHNNILYIYGGYSQAHRRLVNQIIILKLFQCIGQFGDASSMAFQVFNRSYLLMVLIQH